MKKTKFKIIEYVGENIYREAKILKFLRLKWYRIKYSGSSFLKRVKKGHNIRTLRLKYYNNFVLRVLNKDRFNMRFLYKYLLNLKRKLLVFYSYNLRYKFIKRLYNQNKFKGSFINNLTNKYNNIFPNENICNSFLQFIYKLETILLIVVYRSNFIQSINLCKKYIKFGKVLVNNKVIKNPNYLIKVGDIIEYTGGLYSNRGIKDVKDILTFNSKIDKHLMLFNKEKLIYFSKYPKHNDLRYSFRLNWNFIPYSFNLKRL